MSSMPALLGRPYGVFCRGVLIRNRRALRRRLDVPLLPEQRLFRPARRVDDLARHVLTLVAALKRVERSCSACGPPRARSTRRQSARRGVPRPMPQPAALGPRRTVVPSSYSASACAYRSGCSLPTNSHACSRVVAACQGRSKSRPRWRRKSRPPSRWGGVAEGGLRTPGRLRGAGPSCCGQDDSSRRSAPGCGRDGSAGRAGRRSAVRSRRSPSIR